MLDSIYHMANTLKSRFWCKSVMILSLCTHRYYGRHNVYRKSINQLGDNLIQNFSFGEVYCRIYGWKFSFTATRKRSRKT